MRRRILLAAFVSASCIGATQAAAPKPNIVFILADDLRWDAMSCAGHPLLRTPNLDRLAAGGTRFANAFVTTSICAVSRASILTGQYARRHGIHDFQRPISDLNATYPSLLRASGYYTGFIGKWGTAQNNAAYFTNCAQHFDFWAGDMGQTAFWHERACHYIANDGTSQRTNFFCSCPAAARRAEGCGPNGPHPALKDPVHAETGFVPAKFRSFLDQRDPAKPFCLSVSLKAPHGPWRGYAPRYDNDFETADIPRRGNVTLEEALRQPDFLRRSLESERGLQLVQDRVARNNLLRQYYRLILGLDFCVGEVLKELDRRGLAGNTVIVFTSDNGHFAAEHGFFGKWLMHEESIRVPLIVADPRGPAKQRGRVSEALALNIDIAPTVLELAGLRAPKAMQGRSLLPLLRDPKAKGRDAFFYEHLYTHAPKPPRHIEPCEGVRARDWKYIVWIDQAGPAREELYDLRNDPLEVKNLVADPSAAARLGVLRRQHQAMRESLK